MKGKINRSGQLSLLRGGYEKTQVCPHDASRYCGDWCPRFGEPQHTFAGGYVLCICTAELRFDDFTDERGKA